jgi:hypothetical protein
MPTLRITNTKTPICIDFTKNTVVEKNIDKLNEEKKNFLPYTELTYFGYDVLLMGEVTYFISNLTNFLKSINARRDLTFSQ